MLPWNIRFSRFQVVIFEKDPTMNADIFTVGLSVVILFRSFRLLVYGVGICF